MKKIGILNPYLYIFYMARKLFGRKPTTPSTEFDKRATEFDERAPTRPGPSSTHNREDAATHPRASSDTNPAGFSLVDAIAEELAMAEQEKRQKAITAPEGYAVITDADIVSREPAEQASVPKDFGEGAGIFRRPTEPRIPTTPPPTPDAAIFRKGRK